MNFYNGLNPVLDMRDHLVRLYLLNANECFWASDQCKIARAASGSASYTHGGTIYYVSKCGVGSWFIHGEVCCAWVGGEDESF